MSVLGIRNTLRNAAANAEQRAASDAANTFKNLSFVEDSLRDWQTKYPADSWLPRMLLGLQRVYTKIATEESSRRAIDVASWLIQRYPRSAEAVTLRAEFASAMTHQAAVTQAQAAAPQTQAQAAAPPTQAQAAAGPTTAGTQVTTGH